jgi:pimeloyl-ACP methyl ester carboxylesterase
MSSTSFSEDRSLAGDNIPRHATTYHWIEVDGVRVFYREAGNRSAPKIILLHGFPSSSRMYEPLLDRLSSHYHVIAPDYPGFGHSDAPSPTDYAYTFDKLAATIAGLLRALAIDRYVLFMQDYGGPVGFRLALRSAGKVRAIIVQNANAYVQGLGPKWTSIAHYWSDPSGHPEELDKFISLEAARQRHIGTSPNVERYDPDSWTDEAAMLSRPGQRGIQASLLYDYQTNVAAYPAWQGWLRRHQPPTLVLWGRYDPSFIVPGALAFRRDVPAAEVHLLEAGHFALDEAREAVSTLVLEFLGRKLHHPA